MKKKSIPPFMLTEGQRGRILFEFTLGDGAEVPELCGALMVHGQRVDMEAEDEGTLVIPVLPAGVYLAEVRAGGVCVLYGHVEVLPSPLRQTDGDAVFRMTVDCTQDVLRVSLELAAGIPGRRGEPGPQGAQGTPGAPGLSAYELACLHGFAGSEAEWVAAFEGAQAAVSEARARAEDAAAAARAADEAREAAAADKAAAEMARQDTLAAQSKAEEQAQKAADKAALLGDAALKSEDNIFAGKQTMNGNVVLNGMLSGAMLAQINYLQHKYDTCKTAEEMKAIDPNYNSDLNTGYITCLPSYESGSLGILKVNPPYLPNLKRFVRIFYNQCEELHFYNPMGEIDNFDDTGAFLENNYVTRYLKRMYAVLPNAVNLSNLCNQELKLEEFHCEELPKCVTTSYIWCSMFYRAGLKEFHTRMPALKFAGGAAYGMFQACNQLRVCSVNFPSLVQGERMLDGTILDAASACAVLDGLQVAGEPDWSGYVGNTSQKVPWILTIGIHVDHQNDETVLAAIANAESKGWTLTVQWNGTPTAQASTMAFGQRIYAKVTEAVRPDGTVERIMDWGHYMTKPDGYEQFRSLESAYRYFGLPEAD